MFKQTQYLTQRKQANTSSLSMWQGQQLLNMHHSIHVIKIKDRKI